MCPIITWQDQSEKAVNLNLKINNKISTGKHQVFEYAPISVTLRVHNFLIGIISKGQKSQYSFIKFQIKSN